jgi:hypothetical protein
LDSVADAKLGNVREGKGMVASIGRVMESEKVEMAWAH